ncbi:Protein of unknown function [Gryllus bimaculatus]|nr:Protein of unknown function [Gryllus bimaculatus]
MFVHVHFVKTSPLPLKAKVLEGGGRRTSGREGRASAELGGLAPVVETFWGSGGARGWRGLGAACAAAAAVRAAAAGGGEAASAPAPRPPRSRTPGACRARPPRPAPAPRSGARLAVGTFLYTVGDVQISLAAMPPLKQNESTPGLVESRGRVPLEDIVGAAGAAAAAGGVAGAGAGRAAAHTRCASRRLPHQPRRAPAPPGASRWRSRFGRRPADSSDEERARCSAPGPPPPPRRRAAAAASTDPALAPRSLFRAGKRQVGGHNCIISSNAGKQLYVRVLAEREDQSSTKVTDETKLEE